jgi:hypothetical protein
MLVGAMPLITVCLDVRPFITYRAPKRLNQWYPFHIDRVLKQFPFQVHPPPCLIFQEEDQQVASRHLHADMCPVVAELQNTGPGRSIRRWC